MCYKISKEEQHDYVMPPDATLSFNDNSPHTVMFLPDSNPAILVIDEEGIIFKGERVKDAGEAYAAWMETMTIINSGNKGK